MSEVPETPSDDNVLGVRKGSGPDQYGGSFAGGQSGGGAYANPHVDPSAGGEKADKPSSGGQSHQGYYGGGQAGENGAAENDHHAASVRNSPTDDTGKYTDQPSQQTGSANADFQRAVTRKAGHPDHGPDHAEEAAAPGDLVQGSDGEQVTGKP